MNTIDKKIESAKRHFLMTGLLLLKDFVGILGTIWTLLVLFNWVPGYEFKRVRAHSVQPQVYLFPAQKVKLNMTFFDGSQTDSIQWVKWSLKKDNAEKFSAKDLLPSVIIPDSEGGIYQLEVKLKLTGEDFERSGSSNIYVVQDEPSKVKTNEKTTVKADTAGLSAQLLELVHQRGAEVYQGKGLWQQVENAIIGSTAIEFGGAGFKMDSFHRFTGTRWSKITAFKRDFCHLKKRGPSSQHEA